MIIEIENKIKSLDNSHASNLFHFSRGSSSYQLNWSVRVMRANYKQKLSRIALFAGCPSAYKEHEYFVAAVQRERKNSKYI